MDKEPIDENPLGNIMWLGIIIITAIVIIAFFTYVFLNTCEGYSLVEGVKGQLHYDCAFKEDKIETYHDYSFGTPVYPIDFLLGKEIDLYGNKKNASFWGHKRNER